MSCGFMSAEVRLVLGDIYQGMRLRYVVEDEPLGTAGPVRLAHDQGILEDRVVIANGDVLTDLDLSAELAWHEEVGAQATLGLVRMEDTSSYGVVPTDDAGRVEEFREKSDEASPHGINAGVYVLERERAWRASPRGGRCPSSARCSRRWWARACSTAIWPPTPTGWTSVRRRATSRPPGTCWRAPSPRPCPLAT